MGDYPIGRAITGEDHTGAIRDAHVQSKSGRQSLLVLTERRLDFNPELRPFINPTKGGDMAQNVGFTGTPTIIHAGVNSGARLTGTTTGTTASHLIDSSEAFTSGTIIAVGMSVKNITSGNEYAIVTAVATNDLTLDKDIFVSGEDYEINPIWVGTAIIGAWNFADSGKVTITAANNLDSASFDNDALREWDVSNFTTLTGKIDLDTYSELTNSILLSFDFDSVPVGDVLNLNDFINTADFSEQSFVVPKAAFNFASNIINGVTITVVRNGGPKPTIKFDDIQWEETGDSLTYTAAAKRGERFYVTELRFSFADDETGIVTVAGAGENHSMTNLGYNKFLSVAALSNGIVFRNVKNSVALFSVTIKQLGDFLSAGGDLVNVISDGTNTFFTLLIAFPEPIVLEGDTGDFVSLTINDDLSSLLQFTAAARGAVEL